ncbi:MAG: LPXTG-motif cell wall anchor protein [Actinomycetia bacterium]|nr:LPXTG-motif cell wall anchor protein [Actinomycetes bacterium]MDQ1656166.1 hypothetical protein [Cryptosporangiaceae bacterium]
MPTVRAQARLAILATVAALAAAALPSPAQADDPQVWFDSDFGASAIAAGSAGKSVPVWYQATAAGGATTPATITARIDASQAPALVVKLESGSGCSAAAAVITCTRIPSAGFAPDGDLRVLLTPARGATAGQSGEITITVSAAGVDPYPRTFPVAVTAPGPDLQLNQFRSTAAPGSTATVRPTIRNNGDRPAKTVLFTMTSGSYSTFPVKWRNCHYQHVDYGWDNAVCLLDAVNLKPCESLTFSAATPLALKIAGNVPAVLRPTRYDPANAPYFTYVGYRVDAFDGTPTDDRLAWPTGTGPALTFDRTTQCRRAATAQETDPRDDYGMAGYTITPPNPTDMAATAAAITGKPGDVVSLKLSITNQGPAAVAATPDMKGGDLKDPYNAALRFTVPSGAQVTDVIPPAGIIYQNWYEEIAGSQHTYVVLPFSLADGVKYTVEFTLKITSAAPSTGSVTAQGGLNDPARSNNTAAVTLNRRAH